MKQTTFDFPARNSKGGREKVTVKASNSIEAKKGKRIRN